MNLLLVVLISYPWPLAPQNQIHDVIGTFGEYRSGPPPHFHNGVDVPDPEGTPVYAVAPGYVTWIERSGFNCGLRVGRFAYIHTIPRQDLSLGDYVNQGEVVGYLNYGNHVHFKDGGGASGRATRNALLWDDGLEPFEDPYHTNVLGVWFFQDNVTTEIPSNALSGLIDIVVKAVDTTSPGSGGVGTNNGIFTIGYGIMTPDTSQFLIPPHTPYVFDTLPPSSALPYTYYQQWSNTSNYYYIVTNEFYGNSYLDTRQLDPGDYLLVILTSDTRNPPDTFYFPITIIPSDTTPPQTPSLRKFVINEQGYPLLEWEPVPDTDAAGYQIFLRLNNSRWALWASVGLDSTYTFSDPPINNMLFSVKMTAFDNFHPANVSDTSHVFVIRKVNGRQSLLLVDAGILEANPEFFPEFAGAAPYLQLETASHGYEPDGYASMWLMFGDGEWDSAFGLDPVGYMNNGKLILSGSRMAGGMADDPVGMQLLQLYGVDSVDAADSASAIVGVPGTPFCNDSFAYTGLTVGLLTTSGTPLLMDDHGRTVAVLSGNDILLSFNIAGLNQEGLSTLIQRIDELIDLQRIEEGGVHPVGPVRLKPVSDGIMLNVETPGTVQIEVFDVSGRQLLSIDRLVSSGWNHIRIDAEGVGIRIVRVRVGGRLMTAKLIDLH